MKRAVMFAAVLAAALCIFPLSAKAESVSISGDRVFVDLNREKGNERSYPLELPSDGTLTIDYWSNYFTGNADETSSIRICTDKNEDFWSMENIGKGDRVFKAELPAGSYRIDVSSDTADGRVTLDLYFNTECIEGNRSAGSLENISPDATLYLSGDTVLEMDRDLIMKDIACLGGSECSLTLTGSRTLTLLGSEAVHPPVTLILRGGIVNAPSLSGFILYDGEVNINGGAADHFCMYGGCLNVESEGDGLTGAFEVNGGEVYVNASGCGIHTELYSGEARILGGSLTIRGGKRAAFAERLKDHMEGTDNLGYRLLRTEAPLCITSNVKVVEPLSGWQRTAKAQYLFPEKVKEIILCAFEDEGWIRQGNEWWYKNADGSALRDKWIEDEGLWYYLKDTGMMAAGETLHIGGRDYTFNEGGVCVDPY